MLVGAETCPNRFKEIVKMRLTKDKKIMMLGVPATRNTWIWDCLSEALIHANAMDEYERNFGKFAIINSNGKRREDWPPHSLNVDISQACKLERSSYGKVAIVRDPWERYIALYDFLKITPNHAMHKMTNNWTFENFIINICIGNCSFDLKPQINFLYDNHGKLDIDYYFRFEDTHNIKEFFINNGYTFKDVSLTSTPKNFSKYYTPQLVEIVRAMCWYEATFFGYSAPDLSQSLVA